MTCAGWDARSISPLSNRLPGIATLSLTLLSLACGSNTPTTPTPQPPTPAALSITCPAAVTAASVDGGPVAVTFAAPTTVGGTAPVTTNCTPASGTSFSVGVTTSSCTAKDAASTPQTASCSVSISVSKVPRLAVTSIDAFGDSITEGGISSPCSSVTAIEGTPRLADLFSRPLADRSRSYPAFLQGRITGVYTAQAITVRNDGLSGELTDDGVVRHRRDVLGGARPQVMLLQEGANDLNQGRSRNALVANLREMTRKSREAGIQVMVGTLLPQRTGGCRAGGVNDVTPVNDAIRGMAAAEGATLVDLYAAFGGVPGTLIGIDGLHPTDEGYEKIAATFFDAIKLRFEN